MVDGQKQIEQIVKSIGEIYSWLDGEIEKARSQAQVCQACGRCCDFKTYDHRLFVTVPELLFLAVNIKSRQLLPMKTSRCPYQSQNRCTVHKYRFAGCRIFNCKMDESFQSQLSEISLRKIKDVCREFQIQYLYLDLPTALGHFSANNVDLLAGQSHPEVRAV